MSFWSTLKSMFRIRNQHKTRGITLQVCRIGGDYEVCLTLPRKLVGNIQNKELPLREGVILKSFERPSIIGFGSAVQLRLLLPSSCPQSPKPATDGLQDKKPPGSFGQPVDRSISDGSSPLGFLPDLGLGLF